MALFESSDQSRLRQEPNRPLFGQGPAETSRRRYLTRVPEFRPNAPRIGLWGVVIPTARATNISSGLALGCRIASDWNAHEVVFRSGDAAGQPFPLALVPTGSRETAVIDLPIEATRLLPRWSCDLNEVSTEHRSSDVGLKRNLGLVLARMSGPCQAALFLDDDIRPPATGHSTRSSGWADAFRVSDVLADLAHSPDLQAVAWYASDFPDNSVVFHARRLAGLPMESFLSGGVAIVRTDGPPSVFSAAYNEDWLYLLHQMQSGSQVRPSSSVKYAGEVLQNPYDPFTPTRARSEELGDLIGETLLTIVGRTPEQALLLSTDESFWRSAITERVSMIKYVRERLTQMGPGNIGPYRMVDRSWQATVACAISALDAALDVYGANPHRWALTVSQFVCELAEAQSEFAELMAGITPAAAEDALDLEEALDVLGLTPYVTWYGGEGGRRRAPISPASGGQRAS